MPPNYLGNLYPTIAVPLAFAEIELALAVHQPARAAALADELIPFVKRGRMRTFLPEARYLGAQARLQQGERERAHYELIAGREAAEVVGSRRVLWQILFAQSQLDGQGGESATGRSLRSKTCEIVAYLADHTPPELRAVFLKLPKIQLVAGIR